MDITSVTIFFSGYGPEYVLQVLRDCASKEEKTLV